MLLIITNSADATATFLTPFLKDGGVKFIRLDTDVLVAKFRVTYQIGKACLEFDDVILHADEVTHVWYRRPEPLRVNGIDQTPELKYTLAEWTEAIEGFFSHIHSSKWINFPANNALASHKLGQLSVASRLGLTVPDTLVTQDPKRLKDFYGYHQGKIIVKPMANGYIRRNSDELDSLIYTNRVSELHLDRLDDLESCPTFFQQYVEKDRDVRVTILDGKVHPVSLVAKDESGHNRCDIRRNNMSDVNYQSIAIPEGIRERLLEITKYYGLRFAAIDLAIDREGKWYYFETNPNGQWAWLDICAGQTIAKSFLEVFRKDH